MGVPQQIFHIRLQLFSVELTVTTYDFGKGTKPYSSLRSVAREEEEAEETAAAETVQAEPSAETKAEEAKALAKATKLGYAEADPTADIEGYDAGRKMAIMASTAFHSRVTFGDVHTEGISNITAADIKYAREMGWD